jgi:hypothetical protein
VVPSAYLYDKCSEPSAIVSWGENEEWVRETPIHSIDNKYLSDFTSSICGSEFRKKKERKKCFHYWIKS